MCPKKLDRTFADNSLDGRSGNDTIDGGDGNDEIDGGENDDILSGDAGNDTLKGGLGADRFQFTSVNDGMDTIEDFNLAEGDKIEIVQASFGATSASQFSYDGDSGALFYDASPNDGIDAIQLGTIENKPVGFSISQDLVLV